MSPESGTPQVTRLGRLVRVANKLATKIAYQDCGQSLAQ